VREPKYIYLLLFSGLVFFACKKSLAPKSYIQWVKAEANGLHKKKEIYPLKVDLLYTPKDYHIVNNLKTNRIEQVDYEKEQERLGSLQYYHVKLSIVDAERRLDIGNYQVQNMAEQQRRLGYLSFGMQKDIYLIEEQDTLPCVP